MTLADIAAFICNKVNQSEAEDLAACRGFLQRRHEMLWQEALWKDSLCEYRATLDPSSANYTLASNWLPVKSILLPPAAIERVIAARTNVRSLTGQRQEIFYRVDYDAFAQSGEAVDFVLLPPCVWEWESAQNLIATRADSDATAQLTLDLLDTDLVTVNRTSVALTANYTTLGTTERVDAVSKAASNGDISLRAQNTTTITFASGNYLTGVDFYFSDAPFANINGIGPTTLLHGVSATATPKLYVAAALHGYTGAIDGTNAQTVAIGLNFGGTIAASVLPGGRLILTATRNNPLAGTAAAALTNWPRRQRLRIVNTPDTSVTIRVLGKLGTPPLSADNDTPFSGSVNTLIAFVQGDMLQRERQYGKAQALFQEGLQLLDQLKRQETVQQAGLHRILPEGGYGNDYAVPFLTKGTMF